MDIGKMKDSFSLQDLQVIRQFWKSRAKEESNRWTSLDTLEFELSMLQPFCFVEQRILDLGCGAGELSRQLLGAGGVLTAVDFEENFSRFFKKLKNARFVKSDVTEYIPDGVYDLILFMGVITHLSPRDAEITLSKLSASLGPSGIAVVKNQVSISDQDFIFRGFSDGLGQDYVGRYPSLKSQLSQLQSFFKEVRVIEYPDNLQVHPNTKHYAFICLN